MATTLEAIRTALENTIKGISLTNSMPGQRSFAKIPPKYNWDDTPDKHKDRGFRVGFIKEGPATVFGRTNSTHYAGTVSIMLRHKRLPNEERCIDRMNTDLGQLREELEDKANFPSGVSLVRLNNWEISEDDDYWETEFEFRMVYERALP